MIFERTFKNLKKLVVQTDARGLAQQALRLGANLALGRVEVPERAVNEGLKFGLKKSEWLGGARVECRDDHFWFEMDIASPVTATLGTALKIRELVLTPQDKRVVFERIHEIDIQMDDSLQRGLAQLGGRLIENVLGFDPVAFTLGRLDFVTVADRLYTLNLSLIPEIEDRLGRELLGKPLVAWLTVKSVRVTPGAFVVQFLPAPGLLEKVKERLL